jgi:hypothetical protein
MEDPKEHLQPLEDEQLAGTEDDGLDEVEPEDEDDDEWWEEDELELRDDNLKEID